MKVDQRFPRSCRLLDSKAFENVFNKPDFRVSNRYFLILGCWSDFEEPRLGVIVAKKNVAKAVQRNRIKRLIRESFRLSKNRLHTADLVVLSRKGPQNLNNSECVFHLNSLIDEIEKKKVNKGTAP